MLLERDTDFANIEIILLDSCYTLMHCNNLQQAWISRNLCVLNLMEVFLSGELILSTLMSSSMIFYVGR